MTGVRPRSQCTPVTLPELGESSTPLLSSPSTRSTPSSLAGRRHAGRDRWYEPSARRAAHGPSARAARAARESAPSDGNGPYVAPWRASSPPSNPGSSTCQRVRSRPGIWLVSPSVARASRRSRPPGHRRHRCREHQVLRTSAPVIPRCAAAGTAHRPGRAPQLCPLRSESAGRRVHPRMQRRATAPGDR